MSESNNYLNEEIIPSVEELLTENVEQAELIQRLLSEKSEIQQIVQEQQLMLQEMKEKIVTLNNSDLQLKEAEQKLRESKQKLAKAEKVARATIEEDRKSKQFYEKRMKEITLKESIAKKRENEANYIIEKHNRVLDEKAKQITASTRKNMEKKLSEFYRLKELRLHTVTVGGVLYSTYVTVLTIMTTIRFKSDFKALIEGICSIMIWIWEKLLVGANIASNVCNNIQNEMVATVLSWVIRVLILLLAMVLIIGGVGWCIYKVFQFYKDNFADMLSVVVSLISFSLLVWFGDYIGHVIKCNLLLIFMIIQVVYIMIRMYLKSRSF